MEENIETRSSGHFVKLLVLRENKWAPINFSEMRFCWPQFTTLFHGAHIRFNASCPAVTADYSRQEMCTAKRVTEPSEQNKKKKAKHFMCPVQLKSYVKQKLAAQRQQNILII